MKINRIALSLMILGLSSALIISCKKPNNEAPAADTETQSSVDAVWATFALTDIEQMCAFGGENQLLQHFYREIPGSYNSSNSTGSMTCTRDTNSRNVNIAFNKTWCYDGRFREGTVFMFFKYEPEWDVFITLPGAATPNKKNLNYKYNHDNGFVGRISLVDYKVDGWQIDIDSRRYNRAVLANVMPEGYQASAGPIKWRFVGDFNFTSPDLADRSKDMKISVDLVKSLVNSNDIKIYNQPVRGTYINWSNFSPSSSAAPVPSIATTAALVAYTGTVCGTTAGGAKFRMIIDEAHPLIRDFTCYADKIGGVSVGSGTTGVVPRYQEFHPFTQGIASYATGLDEVDITIPGKSSLYPRQIYFGNEDDPTLGVGCDNTGFVLIKGIGYRVDFRK